MDDLAWQHIDDLLRQHTFGFLSPIKVQTHE